MIFNDEFIFVRAIENDDFKALIDDLKEEEIAVLKNINFKSENAIFDSRSPFYINDVSVKQGLEYLNGIYYNAIQTNSQYYSSQRYGSQRVEHIRTEDIYGVVLASYRHILGYKNDRWTNGSYDYKEIINHTNEFWELLQVIS